MSNFLRNFGLGIVYIIILPLLVAVILLVGVYGLLQYLGLGLKGIFRFFKGEEFFTPMQEDEEVLLIKKAQQEALANPTGTAPAPAATTSNVYVQNNYYQTPGPTPNPNPSAPNPNQIPQGQAPIEGQGHFIDPSALNHNPTPTEAIPSSNPPVNEIEVQPVVDAAHQIPTEATIPTETKGEK